MKILESMWFTPMGSATIGLVACEDEVTGEIKFYIGEANGLDQKKDEKYISDRGAKFHHEMVEEFTKRVKYVKSLELKNG